MGKGSDHLVVLSEGVGANILNGWNYFSAVGDISSTMCQSLEYGSHLHIVDNMLYIAEEELHSLKLMTLDLKLRKHSMNSNVGH